MNHEDVEQLYITYGPMVTRRCRWLLQDEEMAIDAMHDVFVEFMDYASKKTIQKPAHLLFRMATYICIKHIKTQQKQETPTSTQMLEHISSMENIENQTIVNDLLDRLFSKFPVTVREIAVMYYIDNMTHEQVAETLNITVYKVRSSLAKLKISSLDVGM